MIGEHEIRYIRGELFTFGGTWWFFWSWFPMGEEDTQIVSGDRPVAVKVAWDFRSALTVVFVEDHVVSAPDVAVAVEIAQDAKHSGNRLVGADGDRTGAMSRATTAPSGERPSRMSSRGWAERSATPPFLQGSSASSYPDKRYQRTDTDPSPVSRQGRY